MWTVDIERLGSQCRSIHERLANAARSAQSIDHNLDPLVRKKWMESLSADGSDLLDKRLEWDDLDEMIAAEAFDRSTTLSPAEHENIQLLAQLLDVIKDSGAIINSCDALMDERFPFGDLWAAGIPWALEMLHNRISLDDYYRPLSSELSSQLSAQLLEQLCEISRKVLWLCFGRIRRPGMALAAQLEAKNHPDNRCPDDLYVAFINEQKETKLESILSEFPLLARYTATLLNDWIESTAETLSRIQNDRKILEKELQILCSDELVAIDHSVGDKHDHGRSTAILTFKSDDGLTTKKLIYKPRNLNLGAQYQKLLGAFNQKHPQKPLRQLSILCKRDYGYVEYVQWKPCKNQEEFETFYENAGRLLAILYLLGCTDCHNENVIACGPDLILIDFETLLEPDIAGYSDEASNHKEANEHPSFEADFERSVLRTGLLPQWLFLGKDNVAFDLSGLGGEQPASSKIEKRQWFGINTNGMFVGMAFTQARPSSHLPVAVESNNPIRQFVDQLCTGFLEEANNFIEHRDEWLRPGDVLANFAGHSRRFIFRSTNVYGQLREELLAPESMQSFLSQGFVLEKLALHYLQFKHKPLHWLLFKSESAQLSRLGIPLFSHNTGSTYIFSNDGLHGANGCLAKSGFKAMADRISSLESSDIDYQISLIKGCLLAYRLGGHESVSDSNSPSLQCMQPSMSIAEAPIPYPKTEYVEIARSLIRHSVLDKDRNVNWLGIGLGLDQKSYSFGIIGQSLYDGRLGIAVVLAALANTANENGLIDTAEAQQWRELASDCLRPIVNLAKHSDKAALRHWWGNQSLGLHGGGGMILSLFLLVKLGVDVPSNAFESLWQVGEILINELKASIIHDSKSDDILSGLAGLIGPLTLWATPESIELASVAAFHLSKSQLPDGGWPYRGMGFAPLTGFSHGAAGICAALSLVQAVIKSDQINNSIGRGLKYERSQYAQSHNNWFDHRFSTYGNFQLSWCNGAPGILLSRLCMLNTCYEDDALSAEISNGVDATTGQGLALDTICCGTAGQLGILRIAASKRQLEEAIIEKIKLATQCIESSILSSRLGPGNGYRLFSNSNQSAVYLPSLFTGSAGLALALASEDEACLCILEALLTCGTSNNLFSRL